MLVLAFKGCLNARKERNMQDYVRNSNELVQLSKAESRRLFTILEAPSDQSQDVDRQNQANELKIDSATLADRARNLDVPDQLSKAQDYFLESLELRRDALSVIAGALPGALAQEERRQSTARIAEMMQVFNGSDVLMKYRFRPNETYALKDEDVSATPPTFGALTFLPDIQWVQPEFVADQISGIRGSGGSATPASTAMASAPCRSAASRSRPADDHVQLTKDIAFDIQVVNQGDSTETDVGVTVTVGSAATPSSSRRRSRRSPPGELKTASIPLTREPPTGQNVPITVNVKAVPGEEVTDNNRASSRHLHPLSALVPCRQWTT